MQLSGVKVKSMKHLRVVTYRPSQQVSPDSHPPRPSRCQEPRVALRDALQLMPGEGADSNRDLGCDPQFRAAEFRWQVLGGMPGEGQHRAGEVERRPTTAARSPRGAVAAGMGRRDPLPERIVHEAKVRQEIRSLPDAGSCGDRESGELVPKRCDQGPGGVSVALSHVAHETHDIDV